MKKINLLAGQTSSGGGSSMNTTIANLGLIQMKPLLDIEPSNDVQELYPGDDGVSGYSFIRIKGAPTEDEREVIPSTNKQVITPNEGYLGIKQVNVAAVDRTIDSNITPENIKHGQTILGVEGTYAPVTEPITVTPTTEQQTIVPDMGVDGFDCIDVNAVTADIDANIKPENILKGVNILGVEGIHSDDLPEFDDMDFVKDKLIANGNYAFPVEVPIPEGAAGLSKITLYGIGLLDLEIDPSKEQQDFNSNIHDWYAGWNNVRVNPVTAAVDENIQPENIVKGVSILGVDGSAEATKINYDVIQSYHIENVYNGAAAQTDESDSAYVDINVYTNKRVLANYNIVNDLSAIYIECAEYTGLIWKNGEEMDNREKIIFHDNKTYMYCTHIHDSFSGGHVRLRFKDDWPNIHDFAFYEIFDLIDVYIYRPVILGVGAYYSDYHNGRQRRTFASYVKIDAKALSLFGFRNTKLLARTMNYAACYVTPQSNLIIDYTNYDETDYSDYINNKGILSERCDLSGEYQPGNFNNSNWNNFGGPNEITVISCSNDRKWVGNTMYYALNYLDNTPYGTHMYEFDMPEQPLSYWRQEIQLNNVGQTVNGYKYQPYWVGSCYNMMISHNIGSFECTLGYDNIRNDVNKIINICIFCNPDKVNIMNSVRSPLADGYTINVYFNEEFSNYDDFKEKMNMRFPGVNVTYNTFTIIFDTLQGHTLEAGKNYGFVHSSRTCHSLITL